MREPFNVYFQGGLTYEHSKFGVIKSVDSLLKKVIFPYDLRGAGNGNR